MRRREYQQRHRLYFNGANLHIGACLKFDGAVFNYLAKVLRLKTGDCFIIFNGIDGEFLANITHISKRELSAIISERLRSLADAPNHMVINGIICNINVAFSPLKQVAMEFLLQKATELGVCAFSPLLLHRSIVRSINHTRLEKITLEATEQSERIIPPKIHPVISLQTLLNNIDDNGNNRGSSNGVNNDNDGDSKDKGDKGDKGSFNGNNILIFCDEVLQHNKQQLLATRLPHILQQNICDKNIASSNCNIHIIIGPEGGFTNQEAQTIRLCKNAIGASLGGNILKAETAAIYAVSAVKSALECIWADN